MPFTAVTRWNLTLTLLPQRMVRRHGCQTRYRHCYAGRRRSFSAGESEGRLRPRAGSEFALHCRDLDLARTDLDRTRLSSAKVAALSRMGVSPVRDGAASPLLECNCSSAHLSGRAGAPLFGIDICQGPYAHECWRALNAGLQAMTESQVMETVEMARRGKARGWRIARAGGQGGCGTCLAKYR